MSCHEPLFKAQPIPIIGQGMGYTISLSINKLKRSRLITTNVVEDFEGNM